MSGGVESAGTREKLKNHSYDIFLGRQLSKGVPDEVILDFDATDIPSHGDQDDAVLNVAGAAESPLPRRVWLATQAPLMMSHWGSAPGSQVAPSEVQWSILRVSHRFTYGT